MMACRLKFCLMQCAHVLAVVISVVSAQSCLTQCRCEGTTMDCSHGSRQGFPRDLFIPSSTEIVVMSDNLMTRVPTSPAIPNLLELNLEDNFITELTPTSFQLWPKLQILRLGGNKIIDVSNSAFDGLSQLVKLYLNHNNIETIEAFGSLSGPSSLEMLDLQRNKLTSISIGTFTGIPLLTELNLSSNNISKIEDGSFARLKKLRVLYLHSNKILQLTNATFFGMSSLTRLTLINNKIQNLPDLAFNSAGSLEYLDLTSNSISTITQAAFSGLLNLTALSLTKNNISSIEDDLNLADNHLTTIRKDDFARLTKLTFLTLWRNNITSEGLEDGSFANLGNLVYLSLYANPLTNISAATFEGLVSLESLGLGNNQIQNYPPFVFANLPSLTTINLSNYGSTRFTLHPDTFGNLAALRHLNIAGVTSVSPGVFRHLPCLQTVLMGSRLTCDCDILDLATWLNGTAVTARPHERTSKPVKCYNPSHLRNVPLIDLREEDLRMTCPATTEPPSTQSTVQICPTPSPTTEVSTSSRLVTNPSPTTPLPSSFKTAQPGTCPGPQDVTIQNVQDSRTDIQWSHGGKAVNTDLTGFVIQYQIFGHQSWMSTQKIHSDSRYFTINDLLPDTPYQACVAVLCKDELIQPGLDHCVAFTTGSASLSQATVVGLAVGIPSLVIILGLLAAVFWKMRGRSSSEHDAGYTPERPHRQEADQKMADGVIDNQGNEYRTSTCAGESASGSITSSYLDVGRAADMLNSTGTRADDAHYVPAPAPRPDPSIPLSSVKNPAYTPDDSMNDNIYTTVDDALEDGADANMSTTEDDVYIHVIG
ncbi:leucine-rich repeat-containing protein 15-like [Branchiostoma floridae]|uniref:Leucine-rich repeat-containing protein 15-like n=1 Tax=Branchiostoma floridae TaxID=7739 RepID=A0A9J7HRU0_BRAFL|nr:leucine-rich repeat-containing protein 15-like [Branchiostoma floridae]